MNPAILKLIIGLAVSYQLDPVLIESIISVESHWNAKALGNQGEIGLMQIMPEYTKLNVQQLQIPKYNIREGVKMLSYAKRYCVHQKNFEYIVCFNRGVYGGSKLKDPSKDLYYNKVIEQYKKVKDENKDFAIQDGQ